MPRPAGLPRLGRSVPEILHQRTDRTAGLRQRDNGLPWLCRVPTQATAPVVISARRGCNSAGPRGWGARSAVEPCTPPARAGGRGGGGDMAELSLSAGGHTRARRARSARPTGPCSRGPGPAGPRVADGSLISWQRRRPDHPPDAPPPATTLRARSLSPTRPQLVHAVPGPVQAVTRHSAMSPRCRDGLRPALTAPPRRARQSGRGKGGRRSCRDPRVAIGVGERRSNVEVQHRSTRRTSSFTERVLSPL